MTVYVAEYLSFAWARSQASLGPNIMQEPSAALTILSSGGSSGTGMSTITFSGATRLARITAASTAVGSPGFYYLIGSSTTSTGSPTTMTSTVMNYVNAGETRLIGVQPSWKLYGWSS